jgi:uncharacterized tellurite resistance protein B-like protein
MIINYDEKIAIIYAISAIACADGDFSKEESTLRSRVAIFLGLSNDDNSAVQSMELTQCCRILSAMSYDNKKFAAMVLMQTIMADGVDLQIERDVLNIISMTANLPFVSPNEAYNYLNKVGILGGNARLIWGTLRHGAK